MARSKIYGAGGYTGQFLRDTAFSDEVGPGKFVNRGLDTTKSAPPPSQQVTPTFAATLVNDTSATSHGDVLLLPSTEARNTKATFTQRDVLYLASENQIRQERLGVDGATALGTLIEPAKTNVSPQKTVFTTYAEMEIENGLTSALSPDIRVSRWKATPETAFHYINQNLSGLVSVNNTYSFSVFIKSTGEDAQGFRMKYQGGGSQARTELYYDFSADDIDRIDTFGTNPATLHNHGVQRYTDGWRRIWFVITINFDPFPTPGANLFLAQLPDVSETGDEYDGSAGSYSVYATGLSVVEERALSSFINGNEGVASSRALDSLSWPTTDSKGRSILNQAEGMHAVIWRPAFSRSDLTVGGQQRITHLFRNWLFYFWDGGGGDQIRGRSGDSTDLITRLSSPLQAGTDYVAVIRWSNSQFFVGHKVGGAWVWSDAGAHTAFEESGTLTLSDLPGWSFTKGTRSRNLYVWNQDEGQAWLESFFSGVAN